MSILGINNPTVQTLSKTGYDRAGKARPVVAAVGDKATVSTDAQMRLAQDLVVGRSQAEIEKLFADIGVDVDESPGTDWSAEATAQRIFDFATAFYQKFADDNPDLDEGSKITAYEDEIRGAIERGFSEAIEILEGMQVPGEVLDTANETMTLLSEKLDRFFGDLRGESADGEESQQAG